MSVAGAGMAFSGRSMYANAYTTYQDKPKGEKVKMALIGIGNRGEQDADEWLKTGMVDVTCLCDVDINNKQCEKIVARYPKAKRFQDFREMFDKAGNDFEAVCVAVPDHSHFPISMLALSQGKHVYCEKPLCRTFNEAELLIKAAKRHPNLATQVGNQGHSDGNYFQFKAFKEAGLLNDVPYVVAHMNSSRRWHNYDSKMTRMPEAEPVPKTMDWDTWLGVCPFHDYNAKYHQGDWRSWYDFGMGALGDWGLHLLDGAHEFLELGLPYEISLDYSNGHNDYFYPYSSTIKFRFAARKNMPACDVMWYDGLDNLPPLPKGFGTAELAADIPASSQGDVKDNNLNPGKILYTKDLIFKGGSHGATMSVIPADQNKEAAKHLPEFPKSPSNHYENFLLACQGKEKTRSPFEIAGVLSQVFCLGVIAQRLNAQNLHFDTQNKVFTNNVFANAMLAGLPPRKGWEFFYDL